MTISNNLLQMSKFSHIRPKRRKKRTTFRRSIR